MKPQNKYQKMKAKVNQLLSLYHQQPNPFNYRNYLKAQKQLSEFLKLNTGTQTELI
jgi:hypothetical protein